MACGASLGYLDLLHAFTAHPNTQGGMRNFGAPLALDTLAATLACWLLALVIDLISRRVHFRSPRAAALAALVAAAVAARSLHLAADRLAAVRLLVPVAIGVVVGLVLYRGLSALATNGVLAATMTPGALAVVAALSLCAYTRAIGPVVFAVLLIVALLALAPVAWRYTTSRWLVVFPWAVTLRGAAPRLDAAGSHVP